MSLENLSNPATWHPENLDVELTTRCNLHCAYCYLGRAGQTDMPTEVVDQVVRYAERLARHLKPGRRLAINLHGGEPLLNFRGIERLYWLCRKRGLPVSFDLFTNGASADERKAKWCLSHGITPHRSFRWGLPGQDEYNRLYLREGRLWQDHGLPRRLTITPHTAGALCDGFRWLRDNGYFGPIDVALDEYADWSQEAADTLREQLWLLAQDTLDRWWRSAWPWWENLTETARRMFSNSAVMTLGCGAGWGIAAISCDGMVFACHRCTREPHGSPLCAGPLSDVLRSWRLAYRDDVLPAIVQQWSDGTEAPVCQTCEARQSCRHGCLHVMQRLGGVPSIHCLLERQMRRIAAWAHEHLAQFDPQWYLRPPVREGV